MKKFTLAILLLLTATIGSYAQCIRVFQNPYMPVISNNLGFVQQITATSYSNEFSQISGLIVGTDYLFTYTQNNSNKYITITDVSNNLIVQGDSPLTVEGITATEIRLHYSDNAACDFTEADHTATITALLDCPTPINYTVSDITTTTAFFDWTPQGEETAWQVLALPNGTTAPTASTTGIDVTDDSSHTYLDLTPATKYQFYVRANCGDEFSPWNGPLNFTTACEQVTSITESFTTTPFAKLPICWAQVINGTGSSQNSYARVSTSYGTGSSPYRSVQLYNANTNPEGNLILTLPEVSNLSAGTHRLKFYARTAGGTQSLQFGTVDQANANGIFTELQTISTIGNTFQEYIVDYTSYEGTDTFIAIRHNGAQFSSLFLDEISWEVAPVCVSVSLIEVPAATIEATNATVSWTANGGETEWDVVYGLSTVTDPSTLTPINPAPAGNPETILNGLTPNTNYKVWVRSVCETNNGFWIGPIAFKTACLPTASINENFEAYISNKLPDCWSAVRNGAGISEYALIRVIEYNAYAGSKAFQISNGTSPADTDIMFVSPELTNITAGTHRVRFYAKSGGATGSLQVGTIDNTTTTAAFSEVATIDLTSNYTEYVVDFTATDITDTFFAFRFNTTELNSSIYIDNVIWEPIPACADVTALTVSAVTTTSSTINWSAGNQTQWDVVYGATTVTDPNTLTPIAPAPTVNATASLNGLTPDTSYKVWVRSVCGTENGTWTGPVTFTTPCLPINVFEENFDTTPYGNLPECWSAIKNGAGVSEEAEVHVLDYNFNSDLGSLLIHNANSAATANIMLVSPNLGNLSAGTHRVKFFAKTGGAVGSLQIGTVNTTTNEAVFTEIETVGLTQNYTEYAVNFTGYNGTATNIAFRHNSGTNFSYIYLDNIRWEIAPSCADVTNLTAEGTSNSSAGISWSAGGTETNWQVAYGAITSTDPSLLTPSEVLTATNYTLNGLDDATTFKAWVRSVCGTQNGAWIGPVTFATTCSASTIGSAVMEGFESTVLEQLPICWDQEVTVGTNNWKSVSVPFGDINSSASGSKILYKEYQTSTAVLYSLPFDFSTINAATPIRINTYLHRHMSAAVDDKYTVYANSTPTLMGAQLLFEQFSSTIADPLVGSTGFYNSLIDIPASFYGQAEVYIIIVGHTGSNSSYALGIDNFKVEYSSDMANPDFDHANFKFYPNPVKDVLNLSYTQNISTVEVYNLLGQKVIEKTINSNTAKIDMSALLSGSYIVKVTSEIQVRTIKVIKE